MSHSPDAARFYRSSEAAARVAEHYESLLTDWPVPHKRHHVSTSQGDTFVIECGDATKPPLLLIHGALANSATWMGDIPVWAPHFHLFAVDVIGEPGFSAPSRPPLASDAYARWLEDVLDALSLTSTAIAGISLGGWLALDFASRRRHRVSALAVIVPGGIGPQRNVLIWALPLSLLGAWGRNKVLERVIGPQPEPTSKAMSRFGEMHTLINRVCRPRYDRLPIFSDQALASLDMPVMAVVAGRDVMLAAEPMRRRLEASVPDLEMHYLPEARHFPGSQAERVLNFLQLNAG